MEEIETRVIDDPLPFGARMALVEVPWHWLDKRVKVILLEDDRE